MAVVQISKIQIRRGQKNSGSGVPQLSSAELAWAVDTQELFIGNGSVQEGSPFVGNTKILTEHDNILELASSYRFASTDPSIFRSVARPLVDKIDEIEVSVRDFGAVGDGSTDNVLAFENAFTQLFRNANANYRKVLVVPNGEYLFTTDLSIPSNTILRGETKEGAILRFNSLSARLITATGQSVLDFSSSNRPENIEISNITIARSSGQFVITGMTNSQFKNVKFKGEYSLGGPVSSLDTESAAVFWDNNITGTRVTDVTFEDCDFEDNAISIKAVQTITTESKINIKNCKFFINHTSMYINGVNNQVNSWTINGSTFEEIYTQVFRSNFGQGTKFVDCKFINCGNQNNLASSPITPIVYFGQNKNNVVINCSSNRQQEAGIVSSGLVDSVPEVFQPDYATLIDRNTTDIYLSDSARPLAVFSALNNFTKINYTLRLSNHVRLGEILITVGDDKSKVSMTDNYQYSDTTSASPGGVLMEGFEFSVSLKDNDADSGNETVLLEYTNPLATGATGTISFDVSYGS